MSVIARILLMIGLGMLGACGVAVAGGTGDEADPVQLAGQADRVLGKRAFDAAHSGYAPFEPLVGEAPQRTLARAAVRVGELERDLAVMQRHSDPAQAGLVAELGRATVLLGEARVAIDAAQDAPELDATSLDDVVARIDEAQSVLHGVREERLLAAL